MRKIDACAPLVSQTRAARLRLQVIYETFHHSVRARCRRILRDRVAAEDATQETFLRVQLHLDRISDLVDARLWVHRIAVNYCLNQLRNQSGRERLLLALEHSESDLEGTLLARDEARRLLRRIPDRLHSVAWLRHVEGLDQQAVAEVLGVSRRTVVSRVAELRRLATAARATGVVHGRMPDSQIRGVPEKRCDPGQR